MRDPAWRAALVGVARDPVQVLAVAAATALLVVSASASVLVVWTSGQAAIERLAAASALQQTSTAGLDLVVTVPPDVPDALATAVVERVDAIDGFEPTQRETRSIGWLVRSGAEAIRPVVRANGRLAPAVLYHRGGAIASLEVVAGPDASGEVWLPAELAERLQLAPGDPFEVGFEPVGGAATAVSATTRLAGTYAVEDGRPAGTLADDAIRLPPAPGALAEPAALVLGDAATIRRLGDELGDLQFGSLQAPVTQPPRYEDLLRGVEQLDAFQQELFTPASELGTMVFDAFDGPEVRVATDARRLMTIAEQTAEAVGDQVTGAATAGIIVAVATLAAAVWAGARRNREQTDLELVQGSATLAVATQGVLTVAPGVLVGAVLGRLVVLPLAGFVLPVARVPQPAVTALTPRAVAVAVAALLVVLAVRAADAGMRLSALGGRGRSRSVPVVPMLVVATGVVVLGVAIGPPRPPTDPLVMVLPVLVIAAVAVVALRLVVRLVPTAGPPSGEPSAWWFARRGLAGQPDRLVAVGAAVATAAGLVAHTSVLFASGAVAVEAKAAAVAGAAVVVAVPGPDVPPGDGRSIVLTDDDVEVLPEQTRVRFLAVDAASFADVAAWPPGTPPGVLQAVTDADGTSLPVLLVGEGDPLGDRGTLERTSWWDVSYEVVGRPAALPGIDLARPTMLTTQDALFARLGGDLDPRDGPLDPGSSDVDGPWETQVWLDEQLDEAGLRAAVTAISGGGGVRVVRTFEEVRAEPAYLATTWGLAVLGGLGVVVLALALLLLGATRARDADEAGLELAVLERLGVPRGLQGRATLLERVLLVLVAGGIGTVTGIALTAAVLDAADPAPQIAPPLVLVLPGTALAGLGAALLLGGLVAGLLDHRAARRTDIEEALRVAR